MGHSLLHQRHEKSDMVSEGVPAMLLENELVVLDHLDKMAGQYLHQCKDTVLSFP